MSMIRLRDRKGSKKTLFVLEGPNNTIEEVKEKQTWNGTTYAAPAGYIQVNNFEFSAELKLNDENKWSCGFSIPGMNSTFHMDYNYFMLLFRYARLGKNGYTMSIEPDGSVTFFGEFTFNFQGRGMTIQPAKL